MRQRRDFLKATGVTATSGLIGLAGCLGGDDGGSEPETPGGDEDDGGDGMDEETDEPTDTPAPQFGNGELNFIMSPSEPQDLMEQQYQPVREYLSDELPVPAKLKYARNYSAVLQAMGSGTGDVAETGPFAAALGVREDKCEIALQRFAYGTWDYTSVIVTQEDSDVETLADLEGRTLALADRLSASGSLFPLYMLKEAGLSIGELPTGDDSAADFDANYAGGHSGAFAALDAGQVDAAGVGKFITLEENDDGDRVLKDGFEYVETADGIPRAPIVVSPERSTEEQEMVVDALKQAPDDMYIGADGEDGTDDDLWFSDVRPADQETYQPVIDVAKELGINIEELDD